MKKRPIVKIALTGLLLSAFSVAAFNLRHQPEQIAVAPEPKLPEELVPDMLDPVEPRAPGILDGLPLNEQGNHELGGFKDVLPATLDATALKAGLDATGSGRISDARAIRDSLPANALDRHIMEWAIALSGNEAVSSREIAKAAASLPHWPGMEGLRRNFERALVREKPSAKTVIHAFHNIGPSTVTGSLLLARSQIELGDLDAAHTTLAPIWRKEKLELAQEQSILREFGSILTRDDHRIRMEQMLILERAQAAQKIADLAEAEPLANAWSAFLKNERGSTKLLEQVPDTLRDHAYALVMAKQYRRDKRYIDAAEAISKAPATQDALIDPDAWWIERRVLSRELLDINRPDLAYRVAAGHHAESPAMAADAEFHAGWYALRYLNQPKSASVHFANIAKISSGPISSSRAYYWLGRAAEAGGPGNATEYFTLAAHYGVTFYGQLAAARIGDAQLFADYPKPSDADRQNFVNREAVRAIDRLEAAGHFSRADMLYRDLAQQMTSPGELTLLTERAEKRDNHYLVLRIGKIAAARGLDIGALAHPTGAIPDDAALEGAGKALAYAIARQESEFNTSAISGAGARGLLQLLPGTAKEMAAKNGLAYSADRLTNDAGYNATLGAAYLGTQLDRFNGSYVLTFAGYNAGPRRAAQWVQRYGDPRGMDIDMVVDWIERIPYTETRNYVQRVMENYQVYKMRLSGNVNIASDLRFGR